MPTASKLPDVKIAQARNLDVECLPVRQGRGNPDARPALYEAANVLLSRITRFSRLKRWGMDVAKRRGSKRAKVALARKIGVILHRMWIDGTTYRWAEAKPIAAQG